MQRSYYEVIKARINEPRRFIQVLYGPRQVGKTTVVTQLINDSPDIPCVFATADDIVGATGTWLRKLWSDARKLCEETRKEVLLVIDEVQKVENWSETVKKEWDMDTFNNVPIKVVLLGSSSLLIQQGLTESLAGRFETIYIPHWSYSEMHEAFGWSVEQYVWFGGYPGTAALISDEARWKRFVKQALIETSLSRDILMLTRVDKPTLLHRLFDLGSSYSAQILSLTKIQGELAEKGNLTTLENYLSLLDSAGLLCGLQKYSANIIRKRTSKPKFQVFNNALVSALSSEMFSEARSNETFWGRLVESAVGAHLLNNARTEDFDLYYWNEGGKEVDFVIQRGNKTAALEVKSGSDSYNAGMSEFDRKFHPTAMFTIGTDGIPLDEFLSVNPTELLSC